MLTIELIQEEHAPYSRSIGEGPLLIGRAPSNDLVVSDDQVSWHHAAIWIEGGSLYIRDMGSKNGTTRNGHPIRGAEVISTEDRILLGPSTRLRVSGVRDMDAPLSLLLEEIDAAVRMPIRSDRFHFGSGEDSDFYIADVAPRVATLIVEADRVTLATDDSSLELMIGQIFEIAGRRMRIVRTPSTQAPTVEPEPDRYPYRLTTTLNGATGPEARLEDPRTGTEYVVVAENRAILLYLLARKVVHDLDNKAPAGDAGWMSDDEVSVGVWGRGGPGDANSLHVLVYRLRKEIKKAGFDPWFIEKRRRALRVRLRDVVTT